MRLIRKQLGYAGLVILSGLTLSIFTTGFFVSQSALLEPNLYQQIYDRYAGFESNAVEVGYPFACITGNLTLVGPGAIDHNDMSNMCHQFSLVALTD